MHERISVRSLDYSKKEVSPFVPGVPIFADRNAGF